MIKLPDTLQSVDQVLAVAEELHQYGRQLGRKHNGEVPLSSEAETVLKGLSAAERQDMTVVESLRAELEELAAKAPAVTLVVAGSVPTKLREELTAWLRTNIRPLVLVNFHINPEIGGGVVIRGASRVFDCSYRTGLLRHQANFVKVLERV